MSGTDVYVGGEFAQAGKVAANCVAKWNGTTWSALGAGLNGSVHALAVALNGDLFVGGWFTQAGGAPANYVAKWDGAAWSPLGLGIGAVFGHSPVEALAVSGSAVYVGGWFTQAGGAPANYVAKWDGAAWSALGAGLNSPVHALAVTGTSVYAGGAFTTAGGVAANRIAKWEDGSWSSLSTGLLNGEVLAVAVSGTNVYVAGSFSTAGGVAARNVAKWNGTVWSPLGPGVDDMVRALVVEGPNVYAGGEFNRIGGGLPRFIGKWNGTVWESLGNGLNGAVWALATANNGKVVVGGIFNAVGFNTKVSYAFGVYHPNLVTSVGNATPTPRLVLYPNPAANNASLTLAPASQARPVVVLDALGRLICTALLPARASTVVLNLRGLPAGAYLVRCGDAAVRLVVE
ncbi:T9SS type A sorting domain-containing protein [Hymenobacter bucti]|uniref:T9SS type A sorting domain-containing protein n=1 Tax=Hymenobacter bucti TaxID=1844114 RepID=A0ABW4R0Y5_9BACT